MNHEADGLYYFDAEMFNRAWACHNGKAAFRKAFPSGRVLLTIDNVRKALKLGVNVRWAMTAMRDRGYVTWEEFMRCVNVYYDDSSYLQKAKSFMDALATRARREGILP